MWQNSFVRMIRPARFIFARRNLAYATDISGAFQVKLGIPTLSVL